MSTQKHDEQIRHEVVDGTLILTINRPKVYNALGRDHKLKLVELIQDAAHNSLVRNILITGEGKAFCTGQDLNDRTVQGDQNPVDLGETLKTEWNPLVTSISQCPKPVIAAVNGVCAGAGVSVALACDLIVAHEKVKFVSGFTKIGLIPDAGSSHRFSRAMGPQKAFEFFAFNEPMMAREMVSWGLINCVDEDPMEKARSWARDLAKMAPLSLQTLKRNLRNGQDFAYHDMLEQEIAGQRKLGQSADYQEGLKAFFEKREPQFRGE